MNVDAVRDHFAARLAAAELRLRPFPHLILTEALPPDLHRAIVDSDPFAVDAGRPFGDPSWAGRLTFDQRYDLRFEHDLHPLRRTMSDEPWTVVGDAFSDPTWLGPLLRDRYPAYFDLRFGDIDAIEADATTGGFWRTLHTRTFLQRHEPGFRLDAHTDIPTRIATCVFNLPSESGWEGAGTRLLEPLDPRLRCSGNLHHPIDGFRVVETVPYSPNTCLVFFKTRHSWHSVSPDAAKVPGGRLGLQVQLYEPETGAVVDLSAPDLLRNGQFRRESVPERVRSALRRAAGTALGRRGHRSGSRP